MNLLARLLALVLLAGIGLLVWVSTTNGESAPEPKNGKAGADPAANMQPIPVFTSSTQCKDCHAEVYAEWEGSHHQIAYTNPEVRRISEDFRNKECQACHLPRPILETGLGKRTLPRYDRPNEGVGCITCHMDRNGRIVGRQTLPDAGCSPIRHEEWLTMESCKSCHNQHGTTDQWHASEYPRRGMDCNTCHMPEVQRAHGGIGRGHVYPGAHDITMLRRAAEFRAKREGDKVLVEVENTGAGHNFPTEERHRAVDVLWRYVTEEELEQQEPAFTRLYRFRQPYVNEPGENTQLPAHETWRGELSLEGAPAGKILQLRLVYKRQPYLPDHEAMLLYEHRIPLD